jgi:hypothetical protein
VGHVRDTGDAYTVFVGELKGKRLSEDLGVNAIILNWILQK